VEFWKYSALGNTFLVIPADTSRFKPYERWLAAACDPGAGVGADGVAIVHVPTARLSIYNADGYRAPLSGNGARCAAAWWFTEQEPDSQRIGWRTDAGEVICRKRGKQQVEVRIPAPRFDADAIPARTRQKEVWRQKLSLPGWIGRPIPIYALSVGNPQCVVWRRSFKRDWQKIGRAIQSHRLFPVQTNVVFVRRIEEGLETRFWERGVGETRSSGTGAAAAVVVAVRLGKVPRKTRVFMPGGYMQAHWHADGPVSLTGEVRPVAVGRLTQAARRR
jgi:diaminopimelate epimerase